MVRPQTAQVPLVRNDVHQLVGLHQAGQGRILFPLLASHLDRHAQVFSVGEAEAQKRMRPGLEFGERHYDEIHRLDAVQVIRAVVVSHQVVVGRAILAMADVADVNPLTLNVGRRQDGLIG